MDLFAKLGNDMARLWEAYGSAYLDGIRSTLILAVVATVIGCIIGLICGILNTIPYTKNDPLPKRFVLKLIRVLVRIYVEVFRGTPMVLQAVFIYYGLPYFSNNTMRFDSIWMAAILIVSINTGAYMAETVRGGIISVDPGQTEGAKAIGMTHVQIMTNVILPQAFRNIIPQIGNNFIINIKDTSVMFIIGFTEFFAFHRYITGVNNLYFPSAAIEMIGYLCMTLIASFLLRWLEKHMDGNDSYELVQDDSLALSAGTYQHPDRGTPFDERNPEAQKSMLREELVRIYVEVFRGTPMVLQAVFIYYGLPYFSNNTMRFDSIWMAAILIVSINTGAYMAETVRGGIISVDPGQTEGAKAIGMTHVQIMTNVILPQAFRNIIPQIGNNFIINIKDTSVMFIIGFTEFFAFHRYITGVNNLYFPSAAIEMIGYLCMTLIASFLLRWLEKHMDGNDSYELVQDDSLALSAGTYQHPDRGTPFDERNPEAQKSMLREELRRQAERDAAVREGQKAETRRAHGNETRNQDGGDQ